MSDRWSQLRRKAEAATPGPWKTHEEPIASNGTWERTHRTPFTATQRRIVVDTEQASERAPAVITNLAYSEFASQPWWVHIEVADARYMAAANPQEILQLLEERDHWQQEAERALRLVEEIRQEVASRRREAERQLRQVDRRDNQATRRWREAEQKLLEAERIRREAEERRQEAERQLEQAEQVRLSAQSGQRAIEARLAEIEELRRQVKEKRQVAERRLEEAEQLGEELKGRRREAEEKLEQAEQLVGDAETRQRDAERKLEEARQLRSEVETRQRALERQLEQLERFSRGSHYLEVEEELEEARRLKLEVEAGRQELERRRQQVEQLTRDAERKLEEAQRLKLEVEAGRQELEQQRREVERLHRGTVAEEKEPEGKPQVKASVARRPRISDAEGHQGFPESSDFFDPQDLTAFAGPSATRKAAGNGDLAREVEILREQQSLLLGTIKRMRAEAYWPKAPDDQSLKTQRDTFWASLNRIYKIAEEAIGTGGGDR